MQVLFGFLLTVPFQQGFRRIIEFQEQLYFVTLLLAAAASAFLIAPSAYHRLMFRERDKAAPHPGRQPAGARRAGAACCSPCAAPSCSITDIIFGSDDRA